MKTSSTQYHVYELREARSIAGRISVMVSRDVWYPELPFKGDFFPLHELSVKESCRDERQEGKAETVFTFRYEGGTVVRIRMGGVYDPNFGFMNWFLRGVCVRYYKNATDSQYPMLADEKVTLDLERDFFNKEDWYHQRLPV